MSKKGKTQTIEELLGEVLVPENEQLYEVPENWVWTNLESINIASNPNIEPNKFQNEEFILYSVPSFEVGSPEIILGSEIKSNKQLVSTEDVLISKINPRINRVWTVGKHEGYRILASTEWIVIKSNHILSKYLENYFKSPYFRNILCSNVSGVGGSLTRARPKEVMKYCVPIAPIKEQLILINKIEILLSKIDEAKQLIEEAKETFEHRRAAILDKAFRGGKTREYKNLPEGWSYKKFKEVASVKSNLVNPLNYLDYPHIAPDNIEKHTGKLLDYRTIREDNVKSNKHYFEKGSILYSKIRPYLSKVVIADFEGLCSADMYPIETELENEYLYWYMLSPMFLEQATTAGSRSVLPKINQKELGEILVPVCSKSEQKNTIKFIKGVLDEESIILKNLKGGGMELNQLSEAILSKAFRGELGTNDPNDEPAIELLKSVLQEKL